MKRSYWWAAFNARPFGMPIPPNWFAVAAFGLLGAFVSPGLWLIGAGLEGLYLWAVSSSKRFRNAVDANEPDHIDWRARYAALSANLDNRSLSLQSEIEAQATEIEVILKRVGANESQIADVRQMTWLHLKLLATRASMVQVLRSADRDGNDLYEQEQRLTRRIDAADTDEELRQSLTRQLEVIQSRRAAHSDAEKRIELVEAELERLRQQISLVREQALLATDEKSVASSLNSLSASLNEANRWLKDQRELFAGLSDLDDDAPPAEVFAERGKNLGRSRGREAE
jgi:signal transduction histidine kinase